MKLLLKDCVRYVPYEYQSEAELESMVFEHYMEIFGENALIFPKKKIKSPANIGTIPDAFVINFKSRKWFVVEVELSHHSIYDHIVPQITKFMNAIDIKKNYKVRRELAKMAHDEIIKDPYKKALLEVNGIKEDKFKEILEIIETPPEIVIIIDRTTEKLLEAVRLLCNMHFNVRTIEFQTFKREGVNGPDDHIHLFDKIEHKTPEPPTGGKKTGTKGQHLLKVMIEKGLIHPGFRIYGEYKGKIYIGEILEDGRIRLEDGTTHSSLSKAAYYLRRTSANGWQWWKYRDGTGEHPMDELRRKLTGSK